MLPFPEGRAAAAVAVLKTLKAHPNIHPHLRQLKDSDQLRHAERIARVALFQAWVMPDHEPIEDFAHKMYELARILIEQGESEAEAMIPRIIEPPGGRWCLGCKEVRREFARTAHALRCLECNRPTIPMNGHPEKLPRYQRGVQVRR